MKKVKKVIFSLLILFVLGAVGIIIWVSSLKIPDFSSFENRKVIQSTKMYDRTGQTLLWDIHENTKRTVVPFDQISINVKNAVIAVEDAGFYQHKGIDPIGIARAFLVNIGAGSLKQGASTISQQLVKNAILTKEKSITRKVKELFLTLKLEKTFTKDKILELYLNEIPWGGSNYGIEAASLSYFNKHASEISVAESAYLASMLKAPTYFSPYGNHKKELEDRKNMVIKKMRETGAIDEETEKKAKEEKVVFVVKGDQSIKSPHFSMFIRAYLEEKYGKDVVEQDGLKVTTTLDYELQAKAEEIVKKYAEKNKIDFNASNAGLVSIDPKTGQILTMVGSKDYFNSADEGNFNIALAHRQPGSSIKPFVYATAFKRGYLPTTVLFDLDTEFNSSCNPDHTPRPGTDASECYSPQNYDNAFRGPMQLRYALAQSINIPSIKTLYLAGIKNSIDTLKDLGVTSLEDPNRYGLTLVLGGGEVSLLEMTGAYSVLANSGDKNETTGILKIEDASGNVLEEYKPQPKTVLDKNIALMTTDILADYEAKKPSYGADSPLFFNDRKVASKTGTTNDVKDAWVFGYTPSIAVGVWVGNNDNTPMVKKVAGMITAPLWHAFLEEAFKKIPVETFEAPTYPDPTTLKPVLAGEWKGGETYRIDKTTGRLATEFTPQDQIEYKPVSQVHSILYWLKKEDPMGERPTNPNEDYQFALWEKPIRDWVSKQMIREETLDDVPKIYDDVHKLENKPFILIQSPLPNVAYNRTQPLQVRFFYSSKYQMRRGDFFLNEKYVGSVDNNTFEFSFNPLTVSGISDDSTLKIIIYDEHNNKGEFSTPVKFTS